MISDNDQQEQVTDMGFRFRRSFKIAPGLRVNLSKSGGSVSIGKRGATLNVSQRGVQETVGIPGTGLSYRQKIGGSHETQRTSSEPQTKRSTLWRGILWACILLAFMALISAMGCASPDSTQNVSPEALQAPICQSTAQCNDAWRRAQVWVATHGGYKIQTATDSVIQTFGPGGSSPELAFLVTREPLEAGREQIVMHASCDNFIGCIPKPTEAIANFNAYVKGAASAVPTGASVARRPLGVQFVAVNPDHAASLQMPAPKGVMVATVAPGGAAQQAGIKVGDVILRFGSVDTDTTASLADAVKAVQPGESVPVAIWRQRHEVALTAKF
jgi:hypothetical protein